MKVLVALTLLAYVTYFVGVYLPGADLGFIALFALLSAHLLSLVLFVASIINMLLRRSMRISNVGILIVMLWGAYMFILSMISLDARG